MFPCMIQDMKIKPDSLRCLLGHFQKMVQDWTHRLPAIQGNWPIVENQETEEGTAQLCLLCILPEESEFVWEGVAQVSYSKTEGIILRALKGQLQWREDQPSTHSCKPEPEDLKAPGAWRIKSTQSSRPAARLIKPMNDTCKIAWGTAPVNRMSESVSWSQWWLLRKCFGLSRFKSEWNAAIFPETWGIN